MSALADYLRDHRFRALFINVLGWDHAAGTMALTADGRSLCFDAIAQKRGIQVLWCSTDRLVLLNRALLRKFQKQVARTIHEHILIFSSEEPRKQVWAWAVRLSDGPKLRHREHPFFSATPPGPFLDRLGHLRFTGGGKESVTLIEALDRVRRALDTTAELNLFARRPSYAVRSEVLARAMQQGDVGAFQRFIVLHLPLARRFAKRLQRCFNLPAEDAEQIGVLGLIAAARYFRPERGFQFSTCAAWYVKRACWRHGPEAGLLIRLPNTVFWTCFRHAIDIERLRLAGGPSAVRDEIAQLELLNPWLADRWRVYLRATNVGTLSDRRLLRQARTIPDAAPPPIDGLVRMETAARVRAVLTRLHPRDAEVLRLRYGLDGEEYTLEQIGQQLNLTRERIRQIQRRAEHKLRIMLRNEGLAPPAALVDDEAVTAAEPSERPLTADEPDLALPPVAGSRDTRTLIHNRSG